MSKGHGIGWAVKQMIKGGRVGRADWKYMGMYLALQVPDEHSKMTEPYVYMMTARGEIRPWVPAQVQLLATDWEAVDATGPEEETP